jgi:hypothetical protein
MLQCPKRAGQTRPGVEVRCAICGDTSHPTRDCRQAPGNGGDGAPDATKVAVLDKVCLLINVNVMPHTVACMCVHLCAT